MSTPERTLPSWERTLLAKIDPAHIEAVEEMGYSAAKRRIAIRDDEQAMGRPLTRLKAIPTPSRVGCAHYIKSRGYTGECARYLRRRFENKFKDMVAAMSPPRTEKQIADARFDEWFKAWVVDLDRQGK